METHNVGFLRRIYDPKKVMNDPSGTCSFSVMVLGKVTQPLQKMGVIAVPPSGVI